MFVRLIVIVAIFTVAVAWGARRSDSAAREQVYVVQAGDTVWSIAASHYGGDTREAVWRLEDRNHLAGSLVRPGQKLRLP
jgi:nucleoid-associated protein YgaU